MKDAGIDLDIEENGTTFLENAAIKAQAVAAAVAAKSSAEPTAASAMSETIVLADDSGLEIDYLNKEPGIYSSRYMGEGTSYHIKNQNLIDRLAGVPDEQRTARFVCAMAAVLPDGQLITVRECMEGRIAYEAKGTNGFGYDPIFFLPDYGQTSSELPAQEKNKISHRGKALRAIKKQLESYL